MNCKVYKDLAFHLSDMLIKCRNSLTREIRTGSAEANVNVFGAGNPSRSLFLQPCLAAGRTKLGSEPIR